MTIPLNAPALETQLSQRLNSPTSGVAATLHAALAGHAPAAPATSPSPDHAAYTWNPITGASASTPPLVQADPAPDLAEQLAAAVTPGAALAQQLVGQLGASDMPATNPAEDTPAGATRPGAAAARRLAAHHYGVPDDYADLITADDLDGATAQAAKVAALLNRPTSTGYVIPTEGRQSPPPATRRDELTEQLTKLVGRN